MWMMGLAGVVVVLGGLLVDAWRLVEIREQLAGRADASAVAIASNIDVEAWRRDGRLRIDEEACGTHGDPSVVSCVIEGDAVDVTIVEEVPLTLAGLIHPEPVEVRVTAAARAVRR